MNNVNVYTRKLAALIVHMGTGPDFTGYPTNRATGHLDYFCAARHLESAVSSFFRFLVSDY
jgi:hypothetical protein